MTFNKALRHRIFGTPIEEWIALVPGELPRDAVGLWQVVSAGREGFGLSGAELVAFVKQFIIALATKGAQPVVGATDGVHFWMVMNYGDTPDRIAESVIFEWLKSGCEPDAGGIWFALPHIYEEKRTVTEKKNLH